MGVAPSPRPPSGFLTVRCINRLSNSVDITYTIGQVSGFFPFMLNSTTGNFSVTQDLVYATQNRSYNFSVGCYDNLSPNLSSNASVTISVIEVDKYPPVVSPTFLYLTVPETTPVGTVMASTRSALGVYTVVDMDVGPQGVLNYSLIYPDPQFSVDGTFGSLILVQPFDLDYAGAPSFYNPRIQICDPNICTGMYVYMYVTAQNEHTPMFSQKVYYVTYNDSTPPGQVIPSICTDQDVDVGALQGVVFVVFLNTTPGVFLLNPSTGALTTNITMDYRRTRGYTVQLLCNDTRGLTNTSTVYVTITPPNYNPLKFLDDFYVFYISRATSLQSTIGQITAIDQVTWATLTYSLQSNPYFAIDGHSGTIQTISSVYYYMCDVMVLNASVTDGLYSDATLVYFVLYANTSASSQATPTIISTIASNATVVPTPSNIVISATSSAVGNGTVTPLISSPATKVAPPSIPFSCTISPPMVQPIDIVLPIVLTLLCGIILLLVICLCVCLLCCHFYGLLCCQCCGLNRRAKTKDSQ